jgi:hypothetical protein
MLTFIKNKSGQVSLITTSSVKKGTTLFDLNLGEKLNHRNLRTIELSPNLHIDNPWGRYTNHSCNPNSFVDKKKKKLKALRDIQPGEEINFNYLVNESKISNSFNCNCGDQNCLKLVK